MKNKIKILFFGTPEFAAIVLEKMISAGYKPMTVITIPDKPVGRKQIPTSLPIKLLAEKNKIKILQPNHILDSKSYIIDSRPDLIVLAAYGQILPKEILEIPKYGCLNIHPSLLPKYRGASPIQTAILNGDTETGSTIMLMDEGMDHGPIVTQQQLKLPISITKMTSVELTKELAELGANLLIETLPKWVNNKIKAVPQDDSKATFTKIIAKENGNIDWYKSAEEIERMIRAYNPWPGSYTNLTIKQTSNLAKKLKIIKANMLKMKNKKEPGMVFLAPNKILAVTCGENVLILEEVQLEGKKIMNVKEFINGYPKIIGSILGNN